MKNLMTRKMVLGMLMTLVLAFSVQGTAEAINLGNRNPAVLDFSNQRPVNSTVTVATVRLDDSRIRESVTITVSSGVTIVTPGIVSGTAVQEGDHDDTGNATDLNGRFFVDATNEGSSFPVTVRFTAAGEQTIQIEDNTDYEIPDGDDADNDPDRADRTDKWDTTYYYYVVATPISTTPSVTLTPQGFTAASTTLDFGDADFQIFAGDSNHYQITYRVSGGGRLYVRKEVAGSVYTSSRSTSLTTSTTLPVWLDANNNSGFVNGFTNTVTATLLNRNSTVQTYIHGLPTLEVDGPTGSSRKGSQENPGKPGELIRNAFTATVKDGRNRGIPGVVVRFDITGTTPIQNDGTLIFGSSNSGTLVTNANALIFNNDGNQIIAGSADPLHVRTNSSGRASVDFRLGSAGVHQTEVDAVINEDDVGLEGPTVNAYAGSSIGLQLSTLRSDSDPNRANTFILYALVKNNGVAAEDQAVTFETANGTLTSASTTTATTRLTEDTDGSGIVQATFLWDGLSSSPKVTASIEETVAGISRSIDTVTFNVRGETTTTRTPTPTPTPTNPTLTLSSSALTGTAGSNVPLAATARDATGNTVPGVGVTFTLSTTNSGAVSPSIAITNANGVAQTTVTLPNTNAQVTATATVGGASLTQTASVTVTDATADTGTGTGGTAGQVTAVPESITISGSSSFTGEPNARLNDPLTVRVLDTNGQGSSGETVFFSIIEGRGRLSPGRTRTDGDGYAEISFTPLSTGTIVVEAASGDLSPVTFTITTGEPPDAIVMISGNNQSGRPEARLANPFVVEVIDENDEPVSGVTVTFAVTAGGGSVSLASATTNNNGRAQTTLTLGDEPGDNTVVARVAGLTDRITFRAKSGAEVLVRAAQRPPLYWVDRTNGTLHRLVDEETEALAANLTGAMSIAVDVANNYIYWTAQTGENRGAIRRAGLNGRGAETLKAVSSVPIGLTVDSAGGTIYWTNARGRILSMPVSGGKVTNILGNLSSPGPIALSNGVLYWGEETGRVRRMSLTATPKTPVNIATGLGAPLAVAVAKGKVYWVERGSGGSGRLQRANLNGSNIEQLKTFASGVPIGFTIDSSENKIYWTKGAGKIQRSNLGGKFVKDIVTGLPNPGSIALGTAVVSDDAPTSGRQPDNQQTNNQGTNNQQTNFSRYDINRDGAVNNADTRIVSRVISGAATNPRADVDGSGEVDVTDLILVIANLDDDVAAPAIDVDVKALDLDFDRVQEQVGVLLASGDTSIAAQRALLYLQHLLASARPDETVLLANYPNPFNPETWIPYHLSESTDVQVNIYDSQGVLVRALTLGHQSAGYYTSRSRAAYWDGRNALGERVASGIYFYQLQTDAISPMRKMVILK